MIDEKKIFYGLVVISIIIFFIGLYVHDNNNPNPYIFKHSLDIDYKIEINIDNQTIKETYNYEVNKDNKYRMLYRYWKIPIALTKIPKGLIITHNQSSNNFYVKDYTGRVYANPSIYNLVKQLSFNNEVGIANPNYFKKGKYYFTYQAIILPTIYRDNSFDYLNLKLADEHFPYRSVEIIINDPQQEIVNISRHFEGEIERKGDQYIIKTSSPKNELIELSFLLKRDSLKGDIELIRDIEKRFSDEQEEVKIYLNKLKIKKAFHNTILFLLLIFPFILIIIYNKYGKERFFTVPEMIHFIPSKKKPWIVNLLFNGDSAKTDKNAFIATLLDFYNKKIIDIQPYKQKGLLKTNKYVKIRIINQPRELDEYESRVFNLIKKYSINNVFDTRRIKTELKYDLYFRETFFEILSYSDKGLVNQYIENKIRPVASIIFVLLLLTLIALTFIGHVDLFLIFLILDISLLMFSPYQLFGRWRKDYYKEYLQWQSFRNFLKKLATINKKEIQDIVVWKEFLIYGTALGVGDKVAKAMKELNIDTDEVRIYPILVLSINNAYASVNTHSSSGSFGVGGGFGGGGAGGR